MAAKRPFVFGVVGWKNSGKTTLVAALVAELSQRGFSVSTIKHAHHNFDVDQPGRDSYQHRMAGAGEVALVSAKRVAIMQELRGAPEPGLMSILERLSPCDIVVIEGFKREGIPKIEVLGDTGSADQPLYHEDRNIIAIAGKVEPALTDIPVFSKDNVSAMASFIVDFADLPVREEVS